jgi:hypothetical protein
MANWEYAELILTLSDPEYRGTATTIHHHTETGNIPIPITANVLLADQPEAAAHWDKFSRAVAKMGKDGWELVSVAKYEPAEGTTAILHWFKREIKDT